MNRLTLGSAALAATALLTAGTLGAHAAPAPAVPALAHADAIAVAEQEAPSVTSALGLGADERLVASDAIRDADGSRHLRYDRTYGGLRVFGGDLVVHQDNAGRIRSVDRSSDAKLNLSTAPKIAAADAAKAALASRTGGGWENTSPTLVVYAFDSTPKLAWETVLSGTKPDQTPSLLHVFSDANSGNQLLSYDEIGSLRAAGDGGNVKAAGNGVNAEAPGNGVNAEGTGNSEYGGKVSLTTTQSGTNFQLKDASRGDQQVNDVNHGAGAGTLFTNTTNVWGDGKPANPETAAVDAAYGASETWDYYKKVHGRNGIRNDGVGAQSRVHYGKAYVNAFWQDSCFCMTYGDGTGDLHPLTALDVAGHEMSHGVTAATAKLVYAKEPGGLNESNSDIFGTAVEFHANNAAEPGNYLIGEKIDIFGNGKPLRYMDKPSKDGKSADSWSATVGNLDVHYSSGVGNHFFYLLSEGSGKKTINGVDYDSPTSDGKAVAGIGRDKAEKIWFRALSTYFKSSTNYADARVQTLKAATDLYGASSAEYKGVDAAWAGVNVK